jgi:hypothetical protein
VGPRKPDGHKQCTSCPPCVDAYHITHNLPLGLEVLLPCGRKIRLNSMRMIKVIQIPSMCFRTEIGKCRFACCTTSTKYTGGWTRSLPVPCAAPAAVWMLEAFVNKFRLFATDLCIKIKTNIEEETFEKKNTSHRSTGTGDFCR